jgi:hypothetical protein
MINPHNFSLCGAENPNIGSLPMFEQLQQENGGK